MNLASLLSFVSSIGAGLVALGIAIRARRFVARWALAVGMAVLGIESLCSAFAASAPSFETLVDWQRWRLLAVSVVPGIWLLFSLSYARGNASKFLAKWSITLGAAFLLPPAITVIFRDGLFAAIAMSPAGRPALIELGSAGAALHFLLLLSSVLLLVNLERTYRASVGTMRWRIKFVILGVSTLFVVRIYTVSQVLLYHAVDLRLEAVNSGALLLSTLVLIRSFFRAGHFDVDVYPSQSVLHGSLTVLLAGIYLLIVGLFAKAVILFGGEAAFGLHAFAVLASLVALAVLLQSDRVRVQLGRFVSRHFQRPLYDYRTVWKRFTEGTASRVDQADLCHTLVRLVADTFHSLSVSIWLADEKRETFVLIASTSLSEKASREMALNPGQASEVLHALSEREEPLDIETSRESWADTLRHIHPAAFPNGGNRVCVPIKSKDEAVGVLLLGDRIGGAAFSLQDFDMLKCVGDHAAAGLLNLQLSNRLLQAKELEAFQTMAAFFVHDLKNAASTLNLILQNLPVHFDDPAFRKDALRGASKTVGHINHIIGRLSLLRHEFKIEPVEADLNAVITQAVIDIDVEEKTPVVRSLAPLPKICIDGDQIAKVVTNLVLNARESLAAAGEVHVSTNALKGWVVLTVADNGSGMSREFIDRSLFRAFQTTKKNGLGIGMFQSKMIVETHGGRIAVASELGHGTTVQVFLPVPRQNPE